MLVRYSALLFAAATAAAVAFQLALALGAPWGEYSMGGRFPGRFSWPLRIVALLQSVVLATMGVVVLLRARVVRPAPFDIPDWTIWGVVAVCAVSGILNLASPSPRERRLWAPITLALLASGLIVALGAPTR